MCPAITDAIPPDNCWIDALIAVNAPRCAIVGMPATMAWNGITREKMPTNITAFTAISASIQQLSGGIASVIAGHIVVQGADGRLQNFDVVGYVVVAASLVALALVWRLQRTPAPQAEPDARALR